MLKLTDIVLGIACLAFQGPTVNYFEIKFLNLNFSLGAGELLQPLRALVALVEDPGSFPRPSSGSSQPPGQSDLLSRCHGAQVQRALVLPNNDPTEPSAAVICCFGHQYQMLLASPPSPETAGPLEGQDSELQEVNINDSGYSS